LVVFESYLLIYGRLNAPKVFKDFAKILKRFEEVSSIHCKKRRKAMEYIVQARATQAKRLRATVYEHRRYRGRRQRLGVGRYNMDQLTIGKDVLSSLKVPAGLHVTLYEQADFKGRRKAISRNTAWVGDDFNNVTSGIVVQLAARLYRHKNYRGRSKSLPVGRYNMSDVVIGNNALSSIKIPSGLAVTLYEHADCKGKMKTFTQDTASVARDFARKTSSIEVLVLSFFIPSNVLMFGDTIALRSFHGKYMGAETDGSLNASRQEAGPWEKFTITRSGNTRHNSFISYGDTISLKTVHNNYVGAETDGTVNANRDAIGSQETFTITRSGRSRSKSFVCAGDTISLKTVHNKYVGAETDGTANADRDIVDDRERWRLLNFSPRYAIWGVNSSDDIYRRDIDTWTQIPGNLKQISAGDRDNIWGVNSADDILYWNGTDWTQVAGKLKNVAVAYDGTVWGVDSADDIFRRDGRTWTPIPGKLKQISVGKKDLVWGVNSNDDIFRWTGSGWKRIVGKLKCISVGSDGTVWGVNSKDNIFRRDGRAWTPIPGKLKQISVASRSIVWGVNAADNIYQWTGANWKQVTGGLKWVSIGIAPFFATNLFEESQQSSCPGVVCGAATTCTAAVCAADACGAAACELVACAGAACGAFACSPAACAADACGGAACIGAACVLDADGATGCVDDACAGAAGGVTGCVAAVCGADACGAAACAADACGGAGCAAAACAAATCSGDACVTEACAGDACAAEATVIEACPADACAANVCAINACPADACAADACAIDVIPIVPGI
jgi:hypothetical protein